MRVPGRVWFMARLISNSYARLTHFVTKHLKNLFPCNLRPFAIEIALAIFRHSPSCSHNNWIVTVDEMGCEVTSCKLNSPHLTPILRAAPPSSQNVILLRLVYPDVCQPSREEMFRYIYGVFFCQMLVPAVSGRSACLSVCLYV